MATTRRRCGAASRHPRRNPRPARSRESIAPEGPARTSEAQGLALEYGLEEQEEQEREPRQEEEGEATLPDRAEPHARAGDRLADLWLSHGVPHASRGHA